MIILEFAAKNEADAAALGVQSRADRLVEVLHIWVSSRDIFIHLSTNFFDR